MNDMDLIRSESHIIYVNNVLKTGLCNLDDKRFWINLINSLAYGHLKFSMSINVVAYISGDQLLNCFVYCWSRPTL